ncbi:hypothetical protein Alches_18750 [Alicyclobacillus hesperidum subsp. aegles]|uniref:hypothetical protein n=1 Tax=Alicyclobacillus hesperidum TaxID=89784 RepID=UPI00222B2763|nr:hypothetical protein [Alicyclobacillus hesperidum]GLG01834.1 hypothetical protein Alches_18750 [Alicyclobacillus hesperidum subsp. aegles]
MTNVDPFLYAPVVAGFWSHRDLVEDVFTLDDLLDAHEILQVRAENEWRQAEYLRERSEMP